MSRQLAKEKCQQADSLLVMARKNNSDRQMIIQAIELYQDVIGMKEVKIADPYVGIAYLAFSTGDVERARGMLYTAQGIEPMNMKVNLMLQRIEKAVSRGAVPDYIPLPSLAHTERLETDPTEEQEQLQTASLATQSDLVLAAPTESEKELPPALKITVDLGPPNVPNKASEGEQVLLLQKLLAKLGFKVAASQKYDPPTFSAVRNFQARKMIPINGIVEQKTRAFFNHILSKMKPADLRLQATPEAEGASEADIWDDTEVPESFTSDLGPAEQAGKISSGLEVLLLQELLKKLGHPVEISGEYDKAVFTAIRSIQSSHRLPVSGAADAKTRQVLNQLLKTTFVENATKVQLTQLVWRFRSERQLPTKSLFAAYLDELFKQLFGLLKQPPVPDTELWQKPPTPTRLLLEHRLGTAGQMGIISEGEEVATVQDFLVRAGYPLDIHHKFDLQTFTQLKAWQQKNGLAVTGETDAPTRDAINALLQLRYDEETAIEAIWDCLLDFQATLNVPMSQPCYAQVETLLQTILYGESLPPLVSELGPANRPGKVSQGFEVQLLQETLRHLGFAVSECNGSYDTPTYNAVRSFQQQHKLPMTGLVDAKTSELLNPELRMMVQHQDD